MNDGRHSDFTYTSFANRKTSQSITYELDGKSPSNFLPSLMKKVASYSP